MMRAKRQGPVLAALVSAWGCGGGAQPDAKPEEYWWKGETDCDPAGAPVAASPQGVLAMWWKCMHGSLASYAELRSWDMATGDLLGRNRTDPSDVEQPLLPAFGSDGWIAQVVPLGNGALRVTSPEGATWWEVPLGAAASTSPSIGAGDVVYVGDSAGVVYAFSPAGDPLWATSIGGRPANRIGIGRDGALYALARTGARFELVSLTKDGAVRWRVPADVPVASLAITRAGLVLVPTYLGDEGDKDPPAAKFRLRAFSPGNGAVAWEVPAEGGISSPVEGPDGTIYASSTSGGLVRALSGDDGSEQWRYTGSGDTGVPAVLDNGWLVLGCGDKLCALDAGDGSLSAEMPAGGNGVIHSPLARNGLVVAPTGSGHYYVWDVGAGVSTARGSWARFGGDDGFTGRAP